MLRKLRSLDEVLGMYEYYETHGGYELYMPQQTFKIITIVSMMLDYFGKEIDVIDDGSRFTCDGWNFLKEWFVKKYDTDKILQDLIDEL